MSPTFPDTEVIRTALTLATQAPSVYNTQPWKWRADATSLDLYADTAMRLQSTDPEGR